MSRRNKKETPPTVVIVPSWWIKCTLMLTTGIKMSNRINRASLESNATTGHMVVAILGADELTPLMDSLPDSRPASKRLVEFLSTNPHAPTAAVNNAIAVSNISQEANAANRKLYFLGFMVGCMSPPVPLKNRFKQDTAQHLWSLYKLPKEAANDSEY